jgi:hypothetical protein
LDEAAVGYAEAYGENIKANLPKNLWKGVFEEKSVCKGIEIYSVW